MTLQIPNITAQNLNLVLLEPTEPLSSFSPILEIGAIVRFTVHRNGQEGAILLRGKLLSAQLPETTKEGERLTARIIEGTPNRLTLKLLTPEEQQTLAITSGEALLDSIIEQLQAQLRSVGPQGLRTRHPLNLGENASLLHTFFETPEQLTTPQTLLMKLLGFSTENPFKKAAAFVRTALSSQYSPSLLDAQKQLRTSPHAPGDNSLSQPAEALQRMLPSLTDLTPLVRELSVRPNLPLHSERSQKRLSELPAQLQNEPSTLSPSASDGHLQGPSESDEPRQGEPLLSTLENLATRLEELGAVRESVTQLNPLMNAFREPLVFLLPFLFQGTLFEIRTALDLEEKSDSEKQSNRPTSPLKRLSISLPLPALGPVGVELCFGAEEAMLYLTATSEESRVFIEERLEEVRTLLTAHGFTKLSLHTQVGAVEPPASLWSELIHCETSVVA